MNDSKALRVERFLRRAMEETIAEAAISEPGSAVYLKGVRGYLASQLCHRICWDKYRMRELKDIFDWKKPPEVE